jgi:hypothetical protein
MKLKTAALLSAFFMTAFLSYAAELPDEYYKLKAQIPPGTESDMYEGPGPGGSAEKDLKNACAMADILKAYPAGDKEIEGEREFVAQVIHALMDPKEYKTSERDYYVERAARDDYSKCPEPKRTYLFMMKDWSKSISSKVFVDSGANTVDAAEMTDAVFKIHTDKSFEDGKKACIRIFNKGLFDCSFIYSYFDALAVKKDTKPILDFYNKYFEKIPAKAFNSYQAYHVLHFPAALEPGLKKNIINSFLERVNKDPAAVFTNAVFKGGSNDAVASYLCTPDLTEDPELGKKILKFMQINKGMLENREEGFFETYEEKQYLIKNAAEIGLSGETKASLEKQISGGR